MLIQAGLRQRLMVGSRVIVVAVLLLSMVLAGCATNKESSTSSSSGTGTGSAKASGSSASATAGATGSATGSTVTGTSPGTAGGATNATNHAPAIGAFKANLTGLKATFTFNATDMDRDNLTFILSFGDKSANTTGALPKLNATHTFAAAGNYTATLLVSDGKLVANKTLALKVTSGVAAFVPVTFTGKYTTGSPGLCAYGAASSGGSANAEAGVTFFQVALTSAMIGKPFKAVYSFTAPAAGVVIAFANGAGGFAGKTANAPSTTATTLTGTIPAAATLAEITSCGGVSASVTFTVG